MPDFLSHSTTDLQWLRDTPATMLGRQPSERSVVTFPDDTRQPGSDIERDRRAIDDVCYSADVARNHVLASVKVSSVLERAELVKVDLPAQADLVAAETVYFPLSGSIAFGIQCDGSFVGLGLVGREGASEIMDGAHKDLSMRVLTAGVAYRMKTSRFQELRAKDRGFAQALDDFQSDVSWRLSTWAAAAIKRTLVARVATWLLWLAERADGEALAVTHAMLAHVIGVRRAGVTDAIHLLEGERAIYAKRGSIALRDIERLRAVAEPIIRPSVV